MDVPAPEDDPLDPLPDPAQRAAVAALADAYCEAVLAGDQPEAERVIREAIEAGLPETLIGGDIVAPAMREVGALWEAGRISVADEHLATELSTRILTLQREHFRIVHRRATRRILLAAPEGERHVLGLDMVASVLLHAGYDVRMLGADLPLDALQSALNRHEPAVVGLSVATSATAMAVPAAVDLIRDRLPSAGIIVGGRACGDLIPVRPGIETCTHVADALEAVDALVQRAELN